MSTLRWEPNCARFSVIFSCFASFCIGQISHQQHKVPEPPLSWSICKSAEGGGCISRVDSKTLIITIVYHWYTLLLSYYIISYHTLSYYRVEHGAIHLQFLSWCMHFRNLLTLSCYMRSIPIPIPFENNLWIMHQFT